MTLLRGSKYYRRRADELRHAAAEPCSSDNHDTLLSFAADFDQMANKAERTDPQSEKAAAC